MCQFIYNLNNEIISASQADKKKTGVKLAYQPIICRFFVKKLFQVSCAIQFFAPVPIIHLNRGRHITFRP